LLPTEDDTILKKISLSLTGSRFDEQPLIRDNDRERERERERESRAIKILGKLYFAAERNPQQPKKPFFVTRESSLGMPLN